MPKAAKDATPAPPKPDTSQAFARIWKDYQFYLDCANDLSHNAEKMAQILDAEGPKGRPLRLLEFGAGMGRSLEAFLEAAKLGKDDVALSLIEHDAEKLAETVERFQPRSAAMIASGTKLDDLPKSFHFDVITCTHVLYYVPELKATLSNLVSRLAPDGLLFIAIGGHDNANVRQWFDAFGAVGRPVPHHHGATVENTLGKLGVRWRVETVPTSFEFTDTEENRLRMLRFLFGPELGDLPREDLLASYDAHVHEHSIRIEHADWLFVVRPPLVTPPADKPEADKPTEPATKGK